MRGKLLDLPVCGFIKAYRYFRPVPSNINKYISIEVTLPWLHLKNFLMSYLSSQSNLVYGLSPSLGAFVVSCHDPKFVFHILVYANEEENKYIVDFKRESGDVFAIIKVVEEIKKQIVEENVKLVEEECDAKISKFRFYFNEQDEEIKEEAS